MKAVEIGSSMRSIKETSGTEKTESLSDGHRDLFDRHCDEILPAYLRAVREALLKHKRNGNYVVTSKDGEVVILQPD